MIPVHTTTPVLLLKMEHYGSLGIVRSLGRWGVEVFGADIHRPSPGFSSRYCRKSFLLDVDSDDEETTVERIIDIGRALDDRALLIPTSDETTRLVYRYAGQLKDHFLFPEISYELVRSLSDKRETHRMCMEYGISTAETRYPRSREDAVRIADELSYPVVLKGIDGGRLEQRSGRKMLITRSRRELLSAYFDMEDPEQPNLMVQEYIPPFHDNDWMFNGYFDRSHECRFGFTGRKLRQNPVYTGMTSLGVCERNDDVANISRQLMRSIRYRGIVDIDVRFDNRTGTYKVLDINPRIGATFRLFVARNGMDVVRALYLDLTGQPIPRAVPQEGRKWIVEDKDLLSSFRYRVDGSLTFKGWLRSLRGIREAGYFAWDDPLPFLRMVVNHLHKRAVRFFRHAGWKYRRVGATDRYAVPMPTQQFSPTVPDNVTHDPHA